MVFLIVWQSLFSVSDIHDILKAADLNKDGKINYEGESFFSNDSLHFAVSLFFALSEFVQYICGDNNLLRKKR